MIILMPFENSKKVFPKKILDWVHNICVSIHRKEAITDAQIVNSLRKQRKFAKCMCLCNHMDLCRQFRLFLMIENDVNGDTVLFCVSIHVIFNHKEEPELYKEMILCGCKVTISFCCSETIIMCKSNSQQLRLMKGFTLTSQICNFY